MTTIDSLATTLGVPAERLALLTAYDEGQVSAFEQLVTSAMKREDAAFDAGVDEGLRFIPALLRPAAKKILFGSGRRG